MSLLYIYAVTYMLPRTAGGAGRWAVPFKDILHRLELVLGEAEHLLQVPQITLHLQALGSSFVG